MKIPSFSSHYFLTEKKPVSGHLVHTHKLIQGRAKAAATGEGSNGTDTPSGVPVVDNYGLSLARVSALPEAVVSRAWAKAQTLTQQYVPDVSGEAIHNLNYNTLLNRLVQVAKKLKIRRDVFAKNDGGDVEDGSKSKVVRYCLDLQASFEPEDEPNAESNSEP